MKKVLMIMPSMFIGGAERSLLGLLEAIDYTEVSVSLFMYQHEGEFLELIPKEVSILPENEKYRTYNVSIKHLLTSRMFLYGIARLCSKVAKKIHCFFSSEKEGVWMSMQYTSAFLQPFLPPIAGEYDLGIMYLGVPDTLLNKVCASKKVAWCHTDYDELYPSHRLDKKVYSQLDRVVTVSSSCEDKFKNHYPDLCCKAITIENILSKRLITLDANQPITDMNCSDSICFLSVGRFSHAKNFDNIPEICKYILLSGIDVKWFLIGYGGDEVLIRRKIVEAGMEKHVIILGKKENPYPYIKACDLYVQPSRYEGKCVAVREAQLLGKPVVITNYATAKDQVVDGVDGIIVPMDNKGCAEGIVKLLSNPVKLKSLVSNCIARDYTNLKEIDKLYSLLYDEQVQKT